MNYSLLLTFLLSIISQIGFSQKKFSITLKFPPNFEKNKLQGIRFDDGKKFHDVKLDFIDNKLSITDTFYGTYAAVEIFYTDENNLNQPFQTGFFVSEKPAFVSFKKSKNKNPFADYKTKNAIELINNDYKQLKVFVAKEEKEALDYINNLKNIEVTDSVMTIAQAKADKYLNKQTDFFKQCSGSYFCLWYFKNFIAVNNTIPSDSLLTIFSNAFSDTSRSNFEANEIVKIINGRSEKKYVMAPDFDVKDINGNKVFLKMFQGSYVLIDFWASWCGPCIKELPYIKEIRKKYPEDKLKMVFITQDKDISAFKKAVTKNSIDFGTHIFATPELIHLFGAQAIPKTLLLDPNGLIIYNNQIDNDNHELPILNKLLENKLKD